MTENPSSPDTNPSSISTETSDVSSKKQEETSAPAPEDQPSSSPKDNLPPKEDFMNSFTGKMSIESQNLKEKVSAMSPSRKILFFSGSILIFLSLLIIADFLVSLFGFFVLIIGGILIYLSFSDKNPFVEGKK